MLRQMYGLAEQAFDMLVTLLVRICDDPYDRCSARRPECRDGGSPTLAISGSSYSRSMKPPVWSAFSTSRGQAEAARRWAGTGVRSVPQQLPGVMELARPPGGLSLAAPAYPRGTRPQPGQVSHGSTRWRVQANTHGSLQAGSHRLRGPSRRDGQYRGSPSGRRGRPGAWVHEGSLPVGGPRRSPAPENPLRLQAGRAHHHQHHHVEEQLRERVQGRLPVPERGEHSHPRGSRDRGD